MRLVVRTLPTVCFRECRALRESQGVKRGEDAAGRQKDWSSGRVLFGGMGLHCRSCIHLRFGRFTRWRGVRGRGEDRDGHERSRVTVCSPCDMRVSHHCPHSMPTGHSEGKRERSMSTHLQLRASSGDGSSPPPPTPVKRRTMDIFLYDKMNNCPDVGREFPLFASLSPPITRAAQFADGKVASCMHMNVVAPLARRNLNHPHARCSSTSRSTQGHAKVAWNP